MPRIATLVTARPTYGYRRISATLNRQLRPEGLAPANHMRVYRIMQAHSLLLARKYTERPEHVHDGKVIAMRSNLRWCSDCFEFTCWNGDIILGAFIIDAHDREIIAWRAVVNAGISGSDIRDIMLEAVERRFGTYRAPAVVDMLCGPVAVWCRSFDSIMCSKIDELWARPERVNFEGMRCGSP